MKTNVPSTTEITLTLTLEEWFSIMAVLQKAPRVKMMFEGVLSEYGAQCYKCGGEKILEQLDAWQKS